MCGIFCAISHNKDDANCHLHQALATLLHNRGPDANDKLQIDNVLLAGNVLWQQGAAPQKQPISDGHLVLLFNGDLYNLDAQKPAAQADSAWLLKQLVKCNDDDKRLLTLLQHLEGPYCLILYNSRDKVLYFCRDALGRNSLIVESSMECLRLMSTSYHLDKEEGQVTMTSLELPPLGLYKLHVNESSKCVLYPWQQLNKEMQQQLTKLDAAMDWCTFLKQSIEPNWLLNGGEGAEQEQKSYDLYDLAKDAPKLQMELQLEQLYKQSLENAPLQQALGTLDKLLQRSVATRVTQTAPICRHCVGRSVASCSHAKICILFSGGIDCSILALLADRSVPHAEPIELINVAFERVGRKQQQPQQVDNLWQVPDRQTAWQSLAELQRLCPQRNWQLLEVNVSREELHQQLSDHIRQLIYPLQTVLDECLGGAFWFAAATPNSTARVAILGSGADELFGGYTRHRNAYRRAVGDQQTRLDALRHELDMDWQRIPARNLARDDRCIADSGKTARAPFIEEHVASFVRSLAPEQRCCYALPEGIGDKLLLRLYGHRLGLRSAALLKKRAIQFGSRIADKKQQATQQSDYLLFNGIDSNS
ncbi:asparagine synthetase domain-containing protein CG17486 [Drosophila grimshawi]|uniref:GH17901 n=1 Tax=Drosophila grimshawi TaxID=7222 RepID=B4JX80_DROGR|nr:asparagine synthetase domain-containing protein CG17486 [Drosophila grimshawi]EDV95356.1 GH17901 [Drosophila grimshawi]